MYIYHAAVVNTSMESENENIHQDINPDSMFLNPDYIEHQQSIQEDDLREFVLTHGNELSIEDKKRINEYLSNPLNRTDSRVLGWIKDWIEHPEKSKMYRDKFMFPNYGYDEGDEPEKGWKFEIPIISMEF